MWRFDPDSVTVRAYGLTEASTMVSVGPVEEREDIMRIHAGHG
jgi:hypothetical protein